MYHTGGEKMSDVNKTIGEEAIYDAKSLGTSKMLILGAQHMFAMFGATVLVPALQVLVFLQHYCLQVWEPCYSISLQKEKFLHFWVLLLHF